jgi:hypothetical protein
MYRLTKVKQPNDTADDATMTQQTVPLNPDTRPYVSFILRVYLFIAIILDLLFTPLILHGHHFNSSHR